MGQEMPPLWFFDRILAFTEYNVATDSKGFRLQIFPTFGGTGV